jgi:hypothetical protein
MPDNIALNRILDGGLPLIYAHAAMACIEGDCDRLKD